MPTFFTPSLSVQLYLPFPSQSTFMFLWDGINQISLWGLFVRSSSTGFSRVQGVLHQLIDKPMIGLHLTEVEQQLEAWALGRMQGRSLFLFTSWNPKSWWHFLHFLLPWQLTFRPVKNKNKQTKHHHHKKTNQHTTTTTPTTTWWQQSRAKCYHLLAS